MGKRGFAQKMLIFLLFLKKKFGEGFGGIRCGRCPHTGIGRFPLSREWGEGGDGGKGGMGGIVFGGCFYLVFFWDVSFWGVLAE